MKQRPHPRATPAFQGPRGVALCLLSLLPPPPSAKNRWLSEANICGLGEKRHPGCREGSFEWAGRLVVRTTKRGGQTPRLALAPFSAVCSTGPVRGLGLGPGAHTVPLAVAGDAICVLKGRASVPLPRAPRHRTGQWLCLRPHSHGAGLASRPSSRAAILAVFPHEESLRNPWCELP